MHSSKTFGPSTIWPLTCTSPSCHVRVGNKPGLAQAQMEWWLGSARFGNELETLLGSAWQWAQTGSWAWGTTQTLWTSAQRKAHRDTTMPPHLLPIPSQHGEGHQRSSSPDRAPPLPPLHETMTPWTMVISGQLWFAVKELAKRTPIQHESMKSSEEECSVPVFLSLWKFSSLKLTSWFCWIAQA